MLGDSSRWSHTPVNRVVPYHWLATNLDRAIGAVVSTGLGKARSGTIRRKFINIPVRVPTSARKTLLHLPASWLWNPDGQPHSRRSAASPRPLTTLLKSQRHRSTGGSRLGPNLATQPAPI